MDLQAELIRLKQEIRDLKTSQDLPGYSRMYEAEAVLPAGDYDGVYAWTIYFEDSPFDDAPLVYSNPGEGFSLLPYDSNANTQKIEWYRPNGYDWPSSTFMVYSSKPITSIGPITRTGNTSDYTPPSQWTQVRTFKLANMGTTPGMCLQNCRLGFGISSGTFATARADMQSQLANGTLHDAKGYPPNYIQVPVYIDTGIPEGHVVVWDKGTVYSDGVLISGGLSYYGLNNIWGWGELCDGARVVQKT